MSMDYSLQLRVGAVFIMFSVSLMGVVLPLYFSRGHDHMDKESHQKMANSNSFRIVRAFAAGVMLGVGFIHLLNDGVSKLASVCTDYPSLGFTLATTGTMIVLGFEQIAVMLINNVKTSGKPEVELTGIKGKDHPKSLHDCGHDDDELGIVHSESTEEHSTCDHNHAVHMIAGTDSLSVIIKAYMMEISVAVHSIIIGITLGSLTGPENIPTLRALVVAISFHQFFEGLGLGTVIEAARLHLGSRKIVIFALTFAATVPLGVLIGILITRDRAPEDGPTDSETYITGVLNSVAAGIMIYVCLVEMIGEDFQQSDLASNVGLKVRMFLALIGGTLFMAVLAIWA